MRETRCIGHFVTHFSGPAALVVRSPGRVNLIGEHTDYNDGYVLPAALDLATWVAAAPRGDDRLRTVAARLGETDDAPLADLRPHVGPPWTRYVRGVAALLQAAGCVLPGADLLIDGDLPLSGGLSSSASLELGVGLALAELAGFSIGRRDLALLAQRAEHEFAGVQCGIMDQFAVALGEAGHLMLLDCRSLAVELVPFPDAVRILVLDSAVPRTLAGSAYNRRRAECEEAVRRLQARFPEVRALRDASLEMLAAAGLEGVVLRRARHVITENQRVLDSVAALRRGDLNTLGQLLAASHASLRDDYEVSGPELDSLVEIAAGTPGVLGTRLTGAGFGGSCVALVATPQSETAAVSIMDRYRQQTGRAGQAYVCIPARGVHVLSDLANL
jgi:galactokinase